MKPLAYGALAGLLWILFPSVVTLAAAVTLAALVKVAPSALLLVVLVRAIPSRTRRWAQ
ncbi:hypothetical protein ACIRU8_10315 [Streptomyces sp. NPDC101175]|uniref:hypothetical protein n=1 Tax=Streptomyces sp. NPDC101175 TaxID=3366123 RepID=UPI00383984A3